MQNLLIVFFLLVSMIILVFQYVILRMWKQANDELKKQKKNIDRLFQFPALNPSPVLEISNELQVVYCNKATDVILPDLKKRGIEHPFFDKVVRTIVLKKDILKKQSIVLEKSFNGRVYEQVLFHVESTGSFHLYCYDVTILSNSKSELRNLIDEKNALLTEVHHRVKNNLMVIYGLIQLELYNTTNEFESEALERNMDRIMTMAMLQELIYQQQDFANVNINEFMDIRVKQILNRYLPNKPFIKLDNQTHSKISISVNQAIPLAMIINELCTNACKHAFVGREQGQLCAHIFESNNTITLTISDDGAAFAREGLFDSNIVGVGLSLVKTLTEQLEAKIEYNPHGGNIYTIQFDKKYVMGTADAYFTSRHTHPILN